MSKYDRPRNRGLPAVRRGVRSFSRWFSRADPYVTRGVERRYAQGMKLFWWYGFFIAMSSAFVDSYVTLYALSMGATSLQIGALASLSSLFGMLMPLPGAQWAAHLGRRKPVVLVAYGLRRVALIGAMLLPLLFSGALAVNIAIACFALRAAFMHLGISTWTAFAGSIVPTDRRGRYFSARKTVMALASLLFVPLAGQLIDAFPEPQGYLISFTVSIASAALALYLFGTIPEPASKEENPDNRSWAFWEALGDNPMFLRFTLISMVFSFAWQLGGPYFGVYQVEVLEATPRIIGWLSMGSAMARMVGQQIWGKVVDRRSARWAFSVVLLFIPLLPFIWLPLTQPWQLIFVFLPSGFLWAGREVANFNLLLEMASKARQTQAIAGYNTLIGFANIVGPLVGGQVVKALGYHWDFALSGTGRLLAAVMFVFLLRPFGRPALRNREAPAPSATGRSP